MNTLLFKSVPANLTVTNGFWVFVVLAEVFAFLVLRHISVILIVVLGRIISLPLQSLVLET